MKHLECWKRNVSETHQNCVLEVAKFAFSFHFVFFYWCRSKVELKALRGFIGASRTVVHMKRGGTASEVFTFKKAWTQSQALWLIHSAPLHFPSCWTAFIHLRVLFQIALLFCCRFLVSTFGCYLHPGFFLRFISVTAAALGSLKLTHILVLIRSGSRGGLRIIQGYWDTVSMKTCHRWGFY